MAKALFTNARVLAIAAMISWSSAASSQPTALNDHDIRWDTRELALAEAIAAIDSNSRFAPYRDLIIDRAGLHSISPRFLRALLPLNAELNNAIAGDQAKTHFVLEAAIAAIARAYYEGKSVSLAGVAASPELSPLLDVPPEVRGLHLVAKALDTAIAPNDRVQRLSDVYQELFGASSRLQREEAKSDAVGVTPFAAPTNFLRLPWLVGQTGWSFNGVHSSSGSCSAQACGSPRSSIDFSRGWPAWGANTSSARVLAMHEGTITRFSSCNVRVTHANGWATNYYHLSNVQVSTGQTVYAGQWISDYADSETQALCQGGGSTGPHVHVTLIQNGAQVNFDLSEMSGWRVNAANVIRDYDANCSRMNLSRGAITACAYQGSSPTAWGTHTLPLGFPSNTQCAFDVDGNGTSDASTDGMLLLRHALGFRGTNLVEGALGAGATRNTSSLVEAYLSSRAYDLNVDDFSGVGTDHMLVVRLMRGITGSGLTSSLGITQGLLTSPTAIFEFSLGCR